MKLRIVILFSLNKLRILFKLFEFYYIDNIYIQIDIFHVDIFYIDILNSRPFIVVDLYTS